MSTLVEFVATTAADPAVSSYPLRFIQPEDALDLGHLLSAAPTLPHAHQPQQLGGWIDYAISLLQGGHGLFLPACSFGFAGRAGLLAASIVVRNAERPWLIDLAVAPALQQRGLEHMLITASLAALHHARYSHVWTTAPADSFHARILIECGFQPLSSNRTG